MPSVKFFTLSFFGVVLAAQQPSPESIQNTTAIPADQPGIKVYRHQVSALNRHHRLLCVVPLIGAGTRDDPRRPMYTPAPGSQTPSLKGIIGFQQIPTDDKLFAIVEFVAADPSTLAPIRNDLSLKVFERGKNSPAEIEQAFQVVRRDFKLSRFGMAVR